MNNNTNLLTEISRIHSLMGVEKKIILEQPGALDDLLELGIKQSSGLVDNALTRAIRNNTELFDAIKTIDQKNLKIVDKMDELIATTIRLADNKLADDIIDAFINSDTKMADEWMDMVVDATDEVERLVGLGKSVDDAVSEVSEKYANAFKNSEIFPNEFFDKFARDFDSELKDLNITPPVRTTRSTVDNPRVTDDAVETGARELSGEEVENLINDLQNTPWDNVPLISEEVANHMLTTANRGIFGRWVRGDFRRLHTLLVEKTERIKTLSKLYIETTNSTIKARLEERIKADLYDLALNDKKLLNETNSKLTDVINSFGRERGNIINPNEKRFAEYIGDLRKKTDGFEVAKIMNLTSEGRSGLTILGDAFRASLPGKTKWINTVINIGKSVKEIPARLIGKEGEEAAKKTIEKIASDRQKTWNWVKSGSPRGNPWRTENQKNYIKIIEKGGLSAAKKSYILELVFRLIQWKVLFAVIYTFRNAITSSIFTSSEKKSRMKNCIILRNNSDATQEQINSACSEFNDLFSKWAMDSIEGNLDENDEEGKRFIKDLIDQIFGSGEDELTDIFPGKWDDMVYFVYKTIIFFSNDKQQEELENALRDGQQTAQDQIETTTQEIENTLEEEGISVNDESSDNNTFQPGSKQDLEAFIGLTVTPNSDGTFSEGDVLYKWDNNKYFVKYPNSEWEVLQ